MKVVIKKVQPYALVLYILLHGIMIGVGALFLLPFENIPDAGLFRFLVVLGIAVGSSVLLLFLFKSYFKMAFPDLFPESKRRDKNG